MGYSQFEQDLLEQSIRLILANDLGGVVLLGYTPAALRVSAYLRSIGLDERVIGIVDSTGRSRSADCLTPLDLGDRRTVDLIIVCGDEDKADLLKAYLSVIGPQTIVPDVVIAGTGHLAFRDDLFNELGAPALVPSYATGYQYTRVHLYQYLKSAAAARLSGAIVEFGAFKGGTTTWLARTARELGLASPVIGFDSWDGFPPKQSMLDMYTHPRCVFRDLAAVRAYTDPYGIELVVGDISATAAARLKSEPILLAFVDTDNYSSAKAALLAVTPMLVVGGAIIFDHYETTSEYIYTLGERMAADEVLGQRGNLLQIHGSGVFVKLPEGRD